MLRKQEKARVVPSYSHLISFDDQRHQRQPPARFDLIGWRESKEPFGRRYIEMVP